MSLEGLKWPRREVERALADAEYDSSSREHEHVVRYMTQFQKHTTNVTECAAWAVARAENLAEQRSRRLAHGTGATSDG